MLPANSARTDSQAAEAKRAPSTARPHLAVWAPLALWAPLTLWVPLTGLDHPLFFSSNKILKSEKAIALTTAARKWR